jgi:hypothetical protein
MIADVDGKDEFDEASTMDGWIAGDEEVSRS